jgi:Ca2+-binding RTX toxin-like protein
MTITVALMTAIILALLPGGVVLALNYQDYKEITGGTEGDDTLTGTDGDDYWQDRARLGGDDTIYAEGGDDLIGVNFENSDDWGITSDPGADTYYGGSGKDVLDGRGDGSADTIDCGEGGNDLASYDKTPNVKDEINEANCERLDWTDEDLNDCATKPWDSADVRCKVGTNRGNKLIGTDSPDPNIVDVIWGYGGNDTLRGRRGHDGLSGGRGPDTLHGGPGDDSLYGSSDKDRDKYDKLYGGDGDDRIDATDNENPSGDPYAKSKPDTISCGAGDHDWVVVDLTGFPGNVIDEDPRGVKITENGQAGCEFVQYEETGWKRWWPPWK